MSIIDGQIHVFDAGWVVLFFLIGATGFVVAGTLGLLMLVKKYFKRLDREE